MALDSAARMRFARHLLLVEVGEVGQERLKAAGFCCANGSDARVSRVASDYLRRAGCQPRDDGTSMSLPTEEDVDQMAGDPTLQEAAAAVMGAFAAVERIKEALGRGPAKPFPETLRLSGAP